MTYSYLLYIYARSALAVGRAFSHKWFNAAATMALVLTVAVTLLSSAGPVHAQEAATAPARTAVNINAADAAALAANLKGVGRSRALEIVRYREAYGPFTSVDELAEVRGIGKSTLDENRARITLE